MKSTLHRYSRLLLLGLAAGLLLATPLRAEMIDGIVAVVDDTIIMMSDLMDRKEGLGLTVDDEATLGQVLNLLIEDHIVEKSYRSMGFGSVSMAQARDIAAQTGMNPADARILVMKRTLMDTMVQSRVVVTEAMVQQHYDDTPDYAGRQSLHLKQILIAEGSPKVQAALDALAAGADFDQAASDQADVLIAGSPDIGWVGLDDLFPAARDQLATAAPGDIVGPLTARGYVFIYQVVERGLTGRQEIDAVREEITRTLEDKFRREAFDHWLKTIRAQHYVGIYL